MSNLIDSLLLESISKAGRSDDILDKYFKKNLLKELRKKDLEKEKDKDKDKHKKWTFMDKVLLAVCGSLLTFLVGPVVLYTWLNYVYNLAEVIHKAHNG